MKPDPDESFEVTILFSPTARQVLQRAVLVKEGELVKDAVQKSNFLSLLSPEEIETLKFGIWMVRAKATTIIQKGDQIEIYRPLRVDPKIARRERFSKQGVKKSGLFKTRRPGAKFGY